MGDDGVVIKAVHGVKEGGHGGSLHGQISGRPAAEDQHVHLVLAGRGLVHGADLHTRCRRMKGGGVTPGQKEGKSHIGVCGHGFFYAAADVAVTCDTDSDHVGISFFFFKISFPLYRKIKKKKIGEGKFYETF